MLKYNFVKIFFQYILKNIFVTQQTNIPLIQQNSSKIESLKTKSFCRMLRMSSPSLIFPRNAFTEPSNCIMHRENMAR